MNIQIYKCHREQLKAAANMAACSPEFLVNNLIKKHFRLVNNDKMTLALDPEVMNKVFALRKELDSNLKDVITLAIEELWLDHYPTVTEVE
jgi:hypothetical protein